MERVESPQRNLLAINVGEKHGAYNGWALGTFILWFLLIGVVVWVLLFTFNFNFTRRNDGSGDQDLGKILISAIIISLIIVVIIWLLLRSCLC